MSKSFFFNCYYNLRGGYLNPAEASLMASIGKETNRNHDYGERKVPAIK